MLSKDKPTLTQGKRPSIQDKDKDGLPVVDGLPEEREDDGAPVQVERERKG